MVERFTGSMVGFLAYMPCGVGKAGRNARCWEGSCRLWMASTISVHILVDDSLSQCVAAPCVGCVGLQASRVGQPAFYRVGHRLPVQLLPLVIGSGRSTSCRVASTASLEGIIQVSWRCSILGCSPRSILPVHFVHPLIHHGRLSERLDHEGR